MKNLIKNTVKYLRELSIVIIGVAVTLYVGNLVGTMKEQRDLNLQLTAIAAEMENNLERLNALIDAYENHNLLHEILIKHIDHPKQANDSLKKYHYIISKMPMFNYKKGAYEMFINSGAIKLLADRTLLLNITESYVLLEVSKEVSQFYSNLKSQAISKLNDMNIKAYTKTIDVTNPQWRSLINFYIGSNSFEVAPKEAKELIEKTLSLLNGQR